jgi:hypothetical protein
VYAKLANMQAQGQTFKAEQQALVATGEFMYQPLLDPVRDAITRNDEAISRVRGAANLAAGTLGMVGGGLIATGGALGCAPSAGVSCAVIPLGGYVAYESSLQAQQGTQALLANHQSSEGQRVLESFNPSTYPGERDPVKEVGIDAAKLGITVLAGKLIPKALANAEGLSANAAHDVGIFSKSSASDFIPAAGKSVSPGIDGYFAAQGLTRDPLTFPEGVQMVGVLERGGLSRQQALDAVESFINSGKTLPVATPLDVTDKLVKVVPSGGAPSASTGYWMRESELQKLLQNPATLPQQLGLPPGMQVSTYDVYQIAPKQAAVVFESKIAPTTVNGVPNTTGGATQSLVLDRSQFSVPIKTGSITTK